MAFVEAQGLSQLDLAFCVDLTGSMSPFINAARAHMTQIVSSLATNASADLRVALVGYRDYGDDVMLETHPFVSDMDQVRKVLNGLQVGGGKDAPEAVFAGLQAVCHTLDWREKAYRIAILVGDAPPHACGTPSGADRYADADPTGLSLHEVSLLLEAYSITLHCMAMVLSSNARAEDWVLELSFQLLSENVGGTYRAASSSADAMEIVRVIGQQVFGDLAFDRNVFQAMQQLRESQAPLSDLASVLAASGADVDAAMARLKKRNLLDDWRPQGSSPDSNTPGSPKPETDAKGVRRP